MQKHITMELTLKQQIMDAYWTGFNQAHYSILHPETCEPKGMAQAGKEWFESTYKEPIHIHHSGVIVENKDDEVYTVPPIGGNLQQK